MTATSEPPVHARAAAAVDHWTDKAQHGLRHLPSAYVIGLVEILIGLLMFIQPERGAATLVDDIYHMPIGVFGVICIISGVLLFGKVSLVQLFAFTVPVLMYIAASIVYSNNAPTVSFVGPVIYIGFYLLILRMFAQEGHEYK